LFGKDASLHPARATAQLPADYAASLEQLLMTDPLGVGARFRSIRTAQFSGNCTPYPERIDYLPTRMSSGAVEETSGVNVAKRPNVIDFTIENDPADLSSRSRLRHLGQARAYGFKHNRCWPSPGRRLNRFDYGVRIRLHELWLLWCWRAATYCTAGLAAFERTLFGPPCLPSCSTTSRLR
jgi:hypothetical protein